MTTRAEEAMKCGTEIDLVMYDGRITSTVSLQHLLTMKSRRVRDDDIFVTSYPKFGTHWVWEIVNMVLAGKAEYAKHWQNIAFLEYRSEAEMEELPSPRVFISHLVPRLMPRDVWNRKCHVINIQRNPKDAIVSFFVQQTNQNWVNKSESKPIAFSGTWDQYVDAFIKGTVLLDSIFDHTLEWNAVPEKYPDARFCQVHFEDLKQNDVREVRRIAEFLGRPLQENIYADIAKACRFDELKQASETTKDQTFHNKWREGSTGYFRKGEVGDWKNWFTVAQNEKFDRAYEENFHKKFPYN